MEKLKAHINKHTLIYIGIGLMVITSLIVLLY